MTKIALDAWRYQCNKTQASLPQGDLHSRDKRQDINNKYNEYRIQWGKKTPKGEY